MTMGAISQLHAYSIAMSWSAIFSHLAASQASLASGLQQAIRTAFSGQWPSVHPYWMEGGGGWWGRWKGGWWKQSKSLLLANYLASLSPIGVGILVFSGHHCRHHDLPLLSLLPFHFSPFSPTG